MPATAWWEKKAGPFDENNAAKDEALRDVAAMVALGALGGGGVRALQGSVNMFNPAAEYGGVRVDVERIKDSFATLLGVQVMHAVFDATKAGGAYGNWAWSVNETDRMIMADFIAENWRDPRAGPLADYLRDSWDEAHTED